MTLRTNICQHCGADNGLHHYQTEQCPRNGVEEWREGRKQEWAETTWQDSGLFRLQQNAEELFEAAEDLVKEIRITIPFPYSRKVKELESILQKIRHE